MQRSKRPPRGEERRGAKRRGQQARRGEFEGRRGQERVTPAVAHWDTNEEGASGGREHIDGYPGRLGPLRGQLKSRA